MKATILLAHGSSDANWCAPFFELEKSLLQSVSNSHNVKLAFMELSSPSIADAVAELSAKGCSNIEILPLFFAAGRHLREDVPKMLAEIEQTYKEQNTPLTLELKPPIGQSQAMVDALKNTIENAL